MAQAVQIGSYCSDFIIQDPTASYGGSDIYYKRVHPNTNRTFYLYIDSVNNKLLEIETPFVQPATALTISQFRIVLTWDKSVKPVYDSTLGIAPGSDMRNVSGTGTTPLVAYKNSATTIRVRYAHSSTGDKDSQLKTSSTDPSLKSYSSTSDTPVEYTETSVPPYTVERSANAVYLVDDRDNDRGVVTSSTEMRYLYVRADGTHPDPPFLVYNLYTPGVTEDMIKRACYRINKKTSLDTNYIGPLLVYTVDVFRGSPAAVGTGGTYLEDSRFGITNGNVRGTSADGFLGTTVTFDGVVDYIVTNLVNDKTIADLFGDFSIGLFKLSYPTRTNTDLYLGYDCKTVSATGTCSGSGDGKKTMVLKNYFIFRQPMYSCQFRMYNLGTNEYMMRIVDPDAPGTRVTLRVNDTPALTMNDDTTTPVTMAERGWSLENQGGGNIVKLRWNFPETSALSAATKIANMYLSITNNVPSLTNDTSANTFVCVKCSKIDPVTGTCSGESTMYIDDDMDSTTSMVPASNYALSGVPIARIETSFTISKGSPSPLFANVFDDGATEFVSSNGDRFFTTQTGVTTLTQRTSPGAVFIGTEISGGEILYAKLTGSDTKFVRATPPTVEEGFGWRVTVPNAAKPNERTIVAYLDSNKGFMGGGTSTTYTFTVNNPNIVVTTGAYDPETNTYPLTVAAGAAVAYKIGTGSWIGPPYTAPLNAAPGTMYTFRRNGTTASDIAALGNTETQVYVPAAPSLSITTTPTIGTVTYNSISVSGGGVVTNLGDNTSSVVVTATPTAAGGGTAIKSTPVKYLTYKSSGVTLSTPSSSTATAYSVSIEFHRGTTDATSTGSNMIATTLAGNAVTPAGPSIGTVTVSGSTLTYSVSGTGGGALSPTIRYARLSGSTTTPPAAGATAGTWLPLDSTVSISPSPAPSVSTGSSGSVTINIVPDSSTTYNYFFKVDNVVATAGAAAGNTAYINVTASTIPASASVQKRIVGTTAGLTGVSVTTNRNGTASGAVLPTPVTANTSLVPTAGGSINVLPFTYTSTASGGTGNAVTLPIPDTSRTSVTIALVFRLNSGYEVGLQNIFASGKTWQTGTLHIFINSGGFRIGMAGANWGSEQGDNLADNWNPGSATGTPVTLGTSNPYMVILTMDTSTREAKLRVNGITYKNTFSGSVNNIFGLPRTSGTPAENAAEPIINIGDWVDNSNNHRYLKGNVAEVILYDNKALTNTEIVTLEDYVRTRYSGNSAHFGTSPTISSVLAVSSTALGYTISGSSPGVTVYYKRSLTNSKPTDTAFAWASVGTAQATPVYINGPQTLSSTPLSIAPDPNSGSDWYYFFKVVVSSASSVETAATSGLLVSKAAAVAAPTVTTPTISGSAPNYTIQYTLGGTGITAVKGQFQTPADTGAWTDITLSSASVTSSASFPTTTGSTQSASINIPQTSSARTFKFRVVATNSGGTTNSTASAQLSVAAAPTGVTLTNTRFSYTLAGNTVVLNLPSTTVTSGGTGATITGMPDANPSVISFNFSAPNTSTRIANITSGLTSGTAVATPTIEFKNDGSIRILAYYPTIWNYNLPMIDNASNNIFR